ncbi:hypothetical protein DW352_09190 [Pseudolabrys taiwanensis]|uniref:Uncharacterized protein n=1 Tax=Pseudolabrys taiwanensis TaxID=331696 RepID=A0A345ZUS1_9HYPH|nr:hypothetical protein DW352_09190 [Pseudolabrys taiwanensis]
MLKSERDARERAEARFKFRQHQRDDASQAVVDYKAEAQRAIDRIPRLRAQRTAAEAAANEAGIRSRIK